MKDNEEKAWEEHCKTCLACKKFGKYNNRNGTTESYHAFINGFRASENLKPLLSQPSTEGIIIADKQNPPDANNSCDSESNRRSMNKNRTFS